MSPEEYEKLTGSRHSTWCEFKSENTPDHVCSSPAYDNHPGVKAYRDAVNADTNAPGSDEFFAARGEVNPIQRIIITIGEE